MLLPDTQVMIAQDRIEERLRRAEQRRRADEADTERDEAPANERAGRSWLRQLFLGKASA
jgi:hypothetical protein